MSNEIPYPNEDRTKKYLDFTIPYGFQIMLKFTQKRGWAIYAGRRFVKDFGEDFKTAYADLSRRTNSYPDAM